jgi:pimeloyl-ACP methyl ester carboxylesterase
MRLTFLVFLLAACGDKGGGSPDMAAPGPDMQEPIGLALEVPCTDSLASIYADPGTLPSEKGAILKCAKDRDWPQADLQAQLVKDDFTSPPVPGGVHTYRVLFRTERGDPASTAGYSSALVALPDTPRAGKLPVIVANHATRGEAAACAGSKIDPADESVNNDYRRQVLSLAGYGWAVIAPDTAGYANFGNVLPAGFLAAADEAKSSLDGAKALRKLIPSSLTDQTVLVGHSQGGHTALSALEMANTYDGGMAITAVALYTPIWISMRTFGSLAQLASVYPFSTAANLNAFVFWYMYSTAAINDGPTHALDVFQPAKRTALQSFLDNSCYDYPNWTLLNALGSSASDVFDPSYTTKVSLYASGFGTACPSDPSSDGGVDPECDKWMHRFANDRPHLTGAAANVPIVITWGQMDPTITFDRIQCAIDRLKSDGAKLEPVCVQKNADHNNILGQRAGFVSDWIASKTLGGPAPGGCDSTMVLDASGNPAMCAATPPDSDF